MSLEETIKEDERDVDEGQVEDVSVVEVGKPEDTIASQADANTILDAVKELTTHVADLTKAVNGMKESHDKWVRSGKF